MSGPCADTVAALLGRAAEILPRFVGISAVATAHMQCRRGPDHGVANTLAAPSLLAPGHHARSIAVWRAAMCFTVLMAENGLRLKITAMTKVAMVVTAGHLLTR